MAGPAVDGRTMAGPEAKAARAAQRKAKAKGKKPAKPADCYAAMRMADGG